MAKPPVKATLAHLRSWAAQCEEAVAAAEDQEGDKAEHRAEVFGELLTAIEEAIGELEGE